VPEISWTQGMSPAGFAGVAVFGNGGLDTACKSNPYARLGATGSAGVSLEQWFKTPLLAWRATPSWPAGRASALRTGSKPSA
jgi:long-chain fatty acid transport protein